MLRQFGLRSSCAGGPSLPGVGPHDRLQLRSNLIETGSSIQSRKKEDMDPKWNEVDTGFPIMVYIMDTIVSLWVMNLYLEI